MEEKLTINHRTIQQVRNHLFDMLDKIAKGNANIDEAKAMASVSMVILHSAKLEIEYRKLTNATMDIEMLES